MLGGSSCRRREIVPSRWICGKTFVSDCNLVHGTPSPSASTKYRRHIQRLAGSLRCWYLALALALSRDRALTNGGGGVIVRDVFGRQGLLGQPWIVRDVDRLSTGDLTESEGVYATRQMHFSVVDSSLWVMCLGRNNCVFRSMFLLWRE